ncbi:hypothetical protein [Desulfovibrio sp. ZJ369]|uniref:hypothetical protein n=1 Tax=Desulfovibrio sp. ZJ369 TaxID=2709793 RepID=UPI0013E9D799|nr:hypothetical protein [Desulfovibrio sp. ZJ369]
MSQIEQDIQKLLEAMNEVLERDGYSIDFPYFDFDDRENEIIRTLGFEYNYFCSLLNRCMTRELIKKQTIGIDFCDISLTQRGQEQALSGRKKQEMFGMNIGQITVHGPTQIGNGNIQNFSNFISTIEAQINEASVSETEKKEAKNLLVKLSENPLVSSIIGGLLSGIVK